MSRIVKCVVTNQEGEGLEHITHPGDLGQRIYENVSKEGWKLWLERLTILINEFGLNTADPKSLEVVEKHMLGFFFKEGETSEMHENFAPPGAK